MSDRYVNEHYKLRSEEGGGEITATKEQEKEI